MKTNLNNKLSRRCARIKKVTTVVLSALCAVTMFSVSAFAAEVNAQNFLTAMEKILRAILIMVGAGFAIFGVVDIAEGIGDQNGAAKSTGIKKTMAGAGIIMAGIVLVPVLTGMMSDAFSEGTTAGG